MLWVLKPLKPEILLMSLDLVLAAQKGKVKHISGKKCWVVLERLGFVVTLQLE